MSRAWTLGWLGCSEAGRLPARVLWEPMAKRVLIVDDASFMRNMIREIFVTAGYEVVGEASHGEEAVQRYQELKPDLTTMDIVMPYKNGVEATREIVRANPGAVVIICSALGQEAQVLEALEAGATDFVVKPFRAEDVLAVVRKALGEDA
jgi:two-component system, chemotaxis family, chemotaxis protein CheY